LDATLSEILTSLESATGEKLTVTEAVTVEAERVGKEKLTEGDWTGVQSLLAYLMFGPNTGGNFEKEPKFGE
jgi:hypothetical protein